MFRTVGKKLLNLVLIPLRNFTPVRDFSSLREFATLKRSWGLLSDFKYEQTRPDIFYGHLAEDTVQLIERIYHDYLGSTSPVLNTGSTDTPSATSSSSVLRGKRILDVGGGPGYFSQAFEKHHCDYITCEPDVGEMSAAGIKVQSSVRGSGMDLPFADNSFDISYSSNVAEHVNKPWVMAKEMLRVTKPGGLMIYSYTCWLGPFGGHETGLIPHYIGGEFAARRYERRHGHPPKNRWGQSLFNVSCADGLNWAASCPPEGKMLAAFPRYHPWWAWWMVKLPLLREFTVSNLVLVVQKTI